MSQSVGPIARLRQLRYTVASTGLGRALLDLAGVRPYDAAGDHSFDRAFGTDTAGSVAPSELGISDPGRRDSAILYLPSPPSVTRWMLSHLGIDYRDFTFVDLGSGKGRVVLLAAERPFKAVWGVDISAELCAIARRNAVLYRPDGASRPEIHIENADVTTFDFPEGDLVLHLYHPFEPDVTAEVLRRLDESLATRPRRVVVAYLLYTAAVGPVEGVFARFPRFKRVRYEQALRGQYNWIFYST